MKKVLFASLIAFVIVFVFFYIRSYRYLAAHQPGPATTDVTSFPTSAAWLSALPYAIVAFAAVLVIGWLIIRTNH